jgi:hypothetical protein
VTIYAPARNYEGKVAVKVTRLLRDSRGQPIWEVEALEGRPWDDAGMFGWSSTNKARFYPQELEKVNFRQLTFSDTQTNN